MYPKGQDIASLKTLGYVCLLPRAYHVRYSCEDTLSACFTSQGNLPSVHKS